MPLIGTAGHVDHGKSTLIFEITGRDPDRWKEEKKRGLTIDLGFAWTVLPGGTEVSFVDVPGHERYLKNMLAGIEAIDVVLFVVAADEGWMPQSEEHLAVLDLLDVDRGVVALTKIDAVDADLAELASAEISEKLAGTSLAGAPIHMVSGTTGQGVDRLLEELAGLVTDEQPAGGRPRLWVDRSFTIPGAGTVVTGSLLGGSLSVGDDIEIYPRGTTARVRGLQSHEKSHDTVGPGRRVAVNLAGVDHDRITRGDMIGAPAHWTLSDRFAASLRPARFVDDLDQRGAYTIHIGSASHPVAIVGMGTGVAVLKTDVALPLTVGDRFILRDTGRKLVVAGGQVLDPDPGHTRKSLEQVRDTDPHAEPDDIADRLLTNRQVDTLQRLAAHSRGGKPKHGIEAGDRALSPVYLEQLAEKAVHLVDREHERHPLRPGLSIATLAAQLRVDRDIAELVVDRSDGLERRGPDIARSGHRSGLTDQQERTWWEAHDRLAEGLAVPAEADLGLDPEVLHLKLREGDLVRVGPGLVYLPEQIEEIETLLAGLDGEFTVADFRDAAGLSRKYAVPILEWSDKEGLTVRRGDLRRLR